MFLPNPVFRIVVITPENRQRSLRFWGGGGVAVESVKTAPAPGRPPPVKIQNERGARPAGSVSSCASVHSDARRVLAITRSRAHQTARAPVRTVFDIFFFPLDTLSLLLLLLFIFCISHFFFLPLPSLVVFRCAADSRVLNLITIVLYKFFIFSDRQNNIQHTENRVGERGEVVADLTGR